MRTGHLHSRAAELQAACSGMVDVVTFDGPFFPFPVTLCCSCQPRVLMGPSLGVCPSLAWGSARLACPPHSLPARSGSTASSTSCLWMPCSPPCRQEEKAAVPQLQRETGLL